MLKQRIVFHSCKRRGLLESIGPAGYNALASSVSQLVDCFTTVEALAHVGIPTVYGIHLSASRLTARVEIRNGALTRLRGDRAMHELVPPHAAVRIGRVDGLYGAPASRVYSAVES